VKKDEAYERGIRLLEKVDLKQKADAFPNSYLVDSSSV
jgi:ABC-type polar amino acid transport system ATPase subunit